MKYFMAFMSIPNPNPPSIPVMNLNVLLLSLYPANCVKLSIKDGVNSMIAKAINVLL